MLKKCAYWAGMIGTVFFTLVYLIDGWLTPGYDPVKRYVSELSIGSSGWIQITNFMIFGALLLIFAFGVLSTPISGKKPRAGSIIMCIIAICLFISGPMVTDSYAMFENQTSVNGIIHGILGALVFALAPVCCFIFWRYFRKDEAWKPISLFTLIVVIITVIGIVFMKIAQSQTGAFNDFAGIIQRINLMAFHAWIFVFSYRLQKSIKRPL